MKFKNNKIRDVYHVIKHGFCMKFVWKSGDDDFCLENNNLKVKLVVGKYSDLYITYKGNVKIFTLKEIDGHYTGIKIREIIRDFIKEVDCKNVCEFNLKVKQVNNKTTFTTIGDKTSVVNVKQEDKFNNNIGIILGVVKALGYDKKKIKEIEKTLLEN